MAVAVGLAAEGFGWGDPGLFAKADEIGNGSDPELPHYPPPVDLDRLLGDSRLAAICLFGPPVIT